MNNREILFRGKRVDNGEFIKGYLILGSEKLCYGRAYILPSMVSGLRTNDVGIMVSGFIEVDPSTVGQYTGLTDKKGKKIFEGDIIEFDWAKGDWGYIAEIVFEEAEYRYKPITTAEKVWNCRLCNEEKTLSVIGNVYDNQEIVGGAE